MKKFLLVDNPYMKINGASKEIEKGMGTAHKYIQH
jgi:hypothetical protein